MFPRLALFLTLAGTLLVGADDPWHYIDPGSKFILGVQWHAIQESPMGVQFRGRVNEAMAGIPQFPGMGFLANVDDILVASPGLPEGGKSGTQAPTLIVISGRFDLVQVRGMMNKKSRRAVVQNIEIFESPDRSGPRMSIALVSESTLLVGDTPTIVRALAVQPSTATTLLLKAKQMQEDYQFWVVSSVSPEDVMGTNVMPLPMPAADIRGIDMGMSFTTGLDVELAMRFAATESVHKMKSQLAKTLQLAGKDRNNPEWFNLDKAIKLSAESDTLRVVVHFDSADLEQRMRAYQARRKAQAPTVAEVAPTRPTNSKPVIWNADPPDRNQ